MISLLFALIFIGTAFSLLTDSFLTISNMLAVLLQVSTIAILGFGVTVVIISGGIDLSIGSIVALVGMAVAIFLSYYCLPIIVAVLLGLLIGCVVGLINGVNIIYLRIPPLIATLAMRSIVRGISLLVTNAIPVYNLPLNFLTLGAGYFLDVPIPIYAMIIVFAFIQVVLKKRRFGRLVYSIGGNEAATRLAGVHVDRTKLLAYILCGACAAIAGILYTARLGSGQPTVGEGYEMDAITAAILGGTSMLGGTGTLLGTLFGAFIMGVVNNGQALLNINPYLQLVIKGLIILLAVGFNMFRGEKIERS